MADLAPALTTDETKARRTILWAEFAAIFCFAFGPSLVSAFIPHSPSSYAVTPLLETYEIVRHVARLALVVFVVWVTDGSLDAIGICKPKWRVDVLAAIALVLVLAVVAILAIGPAARNAASASEVQHARILAPSWLYALRLALYYFEIEVFRRGYLVGRLRELLGSMWVAVIVSVAVSCVVARAYTPRGLILEGLASLCFGLSFVLTTRVWAGWIVAFLAAAVTFLSHRGL